MIAPVYPIATSRLLLRPYVEDDLEDLADIHWRPAVARYLYWEPRDTEAVRAVLHDKMAQSGIAHEGDRLSLAVSWPEVSRVVGEVSLVWRSEEHQQGELTHSKPPPGPLRCLI